MIDEMVTYTCAWCGTENTQMRGQCRCKKCGQPRGSQPMNGSKVIYGE